MKASSSSYDATHGILIRSPIVVQKAIDRVGKKKILERLGIRPEDWRELKRVANWYSGYSHASVFAAATLRNFSRPSGLILGSEFDATKVDVYRKQLNICISAAQQLVDIIAEAERKLGTASKN